MTHPGSGEVGDDQAIDDADRLDAVLRRISAAAAHAGRKPGSIRLLLATKTQSPAVIERTVLALRERGVEPLVGENRVQELVEKAPVFARLGLETHLIGPLQSNKINAALRALTTAGIRRPCIETVDSAGLATAIARRIADAPAPSSYDADAPLLSVMVQVNTSGEASKHGVEPGRAASLAAEVAKNPTLTLNGLMTIGANTADDARVQRCFASLAQVRAAIVDEPEAQVRAGTEAEGRRLELSMGMSRDLDLAIAEGATIVRIGSAVFGRRPGAAA